MFGLKEPVPLGIGLENPVIAKAIDERLPFAVDQHPIHVHRLTSILDLSKRHSSRGTNIRLRPLFNASRYNLFYLSTKPHRVSQQAGFVWVQVGHLAWGAAARIVLTPAIRRGLGVKSYMVPDWPPGGVPGS